MKIFITGICGYLGSNLALLAAKSGHIVSGIDNLMYEQDEHYFNELFTKVSSNVEFSILDTRNIPMLEAKISLFKPDVLVHFGDLSSVYSCNHNPKLTESIGLSATMNIVRLCAKEGIPLIYNSTSSLYGTQKKNYKMLETDPLPKHTDLYCTTKYKIEEYIETISNQFDGFTYIVFRPATVFGVAPRFRIELLPNHFCYSAISSGVIKVSELNAYRAFISIDNLSSIYLKIIEKGVYSNSVYNIGSYNLTKHEVALSIQKHFDAKIITVPEIGDLRNLQIDSSKFRKHFFDFEITPFDEEIENVIAHLSTHVDVYKSSNFAGLLNMPLHNWLQLN